MVNPISSDDPSHHTHPSINCMNEFRHESLVPQTQLVPESSSLCNKSSYVNGFPFWPLEMVSSLGTFSPNKELETIFSSSKNMAPLSIKRSIFHNPLDSSGQSYKNFTHRKKRPPKYEEVSIYNKIELGYVDEAQSPNNWFDIDYDFAIGNISIFILLESVSLEGV